MLSGRSAALFTGVSCPHTTPDMSRRRRSAAAAPARAARGAVAVTVPAALEAAASIGGEGLQETPREE